MALPIRTTIADVESICTYLSTKPTGATSTEARAVLDGSVLDGRKVSAYKFWGLIEDSDGRLKLTERGRNVARDKGARRAAALRETISQVAPYAAVIERAVHSGELTIAATEVAAHWHQHFRDAVSSTDKILNDQAVCFFHFAEGADLGTLTIGRRGQPTRFEFDEATSRAFAEGKSIPVRNDLGTIDDSSDNHSSEQSVASSFPLEQAETRSPLPSKVVGNRVFITHGKNRKILNQVKEIVAFGKFDPVIAQERETAAKPVPDKVMDDMRSCQAAVIHVGVDGVLFDKEGNEIPQINGNVLIEIGAAMALYGRNFILVVENGVVLPSNLQGLYECRYSGDELNMEATMKLLKAFNDFKPSS